MQSRFTLSLGGALAAVALFALAGPTAAGATPCGDNGTTKVFDNGGNYFDFTDAGATADRNQPFATLHDSGNNGPAGTPPGPRGNSDSYDDWGALFINGDATSDMHFSANNNSCADEEGGAEHVYPVVTLHGLQVQRKIYVAPAAAPSALPGARILNLISNPGTAAVTTSIQVGDTQSTDNDGDLGSDDDTAVRSSSSGDGAATPADRWFVTSDHSNTAGTENSDPALAHLIDGIGGIDTADFVTLTGTDVSQPEDNLAYRWDDVTIAAGETVAYMSFEVQRDLATGSATQAVDADAAAKVDAESYDAADPSQVTAGMSASEIAALRNWNDLELLAGLDASRKQKVAKKFKVTGTCAEEDCSLSLKGKVKVGKKSYKLAPKTAALDGGMATKVSLKLKSKNSLKKLKKQLLKSKKAARKAKLTVSGTAADLTETATVKVSASSKLKRPKKR